MDLIHERIQSLLGDYALDRLSSEEAAEIASHLAFCPECVALLPGPLEEDAPEGESGDPEVPRPGFWTRLLAFAGALLSPQTAATRGVAACMVILLLGVVGFVVSEMDTGPASGTKNQDSDASVLSFSPIEPAPVDLPLQLRRIPKDDVAPPPSEQTAIFFPEAMGGDHAESADNEGYRVMGGLAGDSFASRPIESGGVRVRRGGGSSGAYDTLGVGMGGGGGGRFGSRMAGQPTQAPAREPEYFKPGQELIRGREAWASPSRQAADQVGPPPRDPSRAADAQDVPGVPERKIIRTGEMEFEVDSFESSLATLTKVTLEEQGFIGTVMSEKLPNGKVRGTVVVRVPPDRLDTLLLKLRGLGDLKSQKIGSEDVTKQYTDLESRLRAARTMEERLIAIIKDGKGQIKDLLQAEKELGEWRTRVESLMGEIRYYSNLIAHSTLTLSLYEKEIRAPWALIQTEKIEMAVEVEEVENAYRVA
ncbi:MAG TPA: DUF4349 domain-containing protein, partial [Planctomycetota bacterium]|nr:DUF4349 domain-containing protein [Planctomycetota bacterium]